MQRSRRRPTPAKSSPCLEQAGHSTFAQFKEIAPGNNFVREMQSGLDDSGRMIALYSPEYESSDHCQAEWSAAYNSDPSGKKRKLIPFLLRPTALNSLARQVAYKSLVGLSKEARKTAILDAIAPKPAKQNIAQVRAELAETASPQPALNEEKQLDAGPNKVFDKPFVDHELVELPYTQRKRIETILSALPRNAPTFIGSALRSYDKELKERGSQPIIDLLNDFASALEREIEEIKATEPELLGPGNASLFESFLRKHALLATHFPLKNEEKFADIPIDEENATGDALAQPIKDVAEKMNNAVESGLATENIGKIASNSAQFASDIAPLPPDASASEPGSRRVTLKRRYVLGTLGFLVALIICSARRPRSSRPSRAPRCSRRFARRSKPCRNFCFNPRLSAVIASGAKQSRSRARPLDCRVASRLAMTGALRKSPASNLKTLADGARPNPRLRALHRGDKLGSVGGDLGKSAVMAGDRCLEVEVALSTPPSRRPS